MNFNKPSKFLAMTRIKDNIILTKLKINTTKVMIRI